MAERVSSEIQRVLWNAGLNSGENVEFGELIGGTGYGCVNEYDHETLHEQEHTFLARGMLLAQQEMPAFSMGIPSETNDRVRFLANEVGGKVKEKPQLMVTNDIKPHLRWTADLHAYFLNVCNKLGGPDKATPRAILDLMDLDGLSLYHVKSHLQKCRLGKFKVKEWLDPKNGLPLAEYGLRPMSSLKTSAARTNLHARFRAFKAKQTPNSQKESRGELYMNLKFLANKHVNSCLQTEQTYKDSGLNYAGNSLANHFLGNVAPLDAFPGRQPSTLIGTVTGIPADAAPFDAFPCRQACTVPRTTTGIPAATGFGTMAEIPPFYYNQPNYYPTYNPLGPVNSYACFQEQPRISVQSAPGGFFANSYPKNFLFGNDINAQLPSSYPENFLFRNDIPMQSSSSYPESFLPRNETNGQPTSPNPENFPPPACGGNSSTRTEEDELIESLLNFDGDLDAGNQNASFDYTNVNGFPSQP